MENVKLDKNKQKTIKVLSKIISVIAQILKVITVIGGVCVILAMIVVPIVFRKIDIKDNSITIDNKLTIDIVEEENAFSFKYKDEVIATEQDEEAILEFKEWVNNNSKTKLVGYIEVLCLVGLITLALTFMVFRHLHKLFKNIHDGDTPFTLENVDHIKRIAYFLIAIIVIPAIIAGISEIIFEKDLNMQIETVGLIQILFLFSMAYIFEYGYQIQLDSKGKMYGDSE